MSTALLIRKFGHQISRQSSFTIFLQYGSVAAQAANAKDIINKQIEFDIELPKAKSWSDTAVLEALASTVESDVNIPYQHLESPEYWHSGTFYTESKRHNLRMHGRAAANYVIQNYAHLFQHDWSADSVETWIRLDEEEVPMLPSQREDTFKSEDTKPSSDMEPSQMFELFLDQKKIDAAYQMYMRLVRNEVELPQALINRFLGLCAYYKASSSRISLLERDPSRTVLFKCFEMGPSESSKVVTQLYQSFSDLSTDQINTKILSYSNTTNKDCTTVVSLFNSETKNNTKLDIDVFNHVILCLNYASMMSAWKVSQELFSAMKKAKVKPNYETFVFYLQIAAPTFKDSVQNMLNHFSKVLLEMKELDIEPGLSIFSSMLSTASKVKNPHVVHAMHVVLNFMEGKQFQCHHPLDISAFYRMMVNCRRDLSLLKKLLRISQHGSNGIILASNHLKSFGFYICILLELVEKDTIENLFYYLQKLAPSRLNVDTGFLKKTIERIEKEKRPEFLPLIALHFPPSKYYERFEQWLHVAIELLSSADQDTKIQFRHIAIIELKNAVKMQSDSDLNNVVNLSLSLLLSTADNFQDVAAIIEGLMKIRKNVTINENIFDRFKKFGIEQNRVAHADRVIFNWNKKTS